jgi:diguanylate cyclase (GGDEF)-like protein
MSAAGFILAINLFVAGIFATAFGVVAAYSRTAEGARWLALAYGLGILNAVLEFILPLQADTRPLEVVVFTVALSAFIVAVIGLARHYGLSVPWLLLSVFALASVTVTILIIGLPHQSPIRTVLYQFPYAIAHVIGAWVVFRYKQRGALEVALLVFFLISGLQFVAKPILAHALGGGVSAHAYLDSLYGAYSQMMTAFLLITNGLLMLLILVRDVMAEMTARSETDKLSGLLNRRGFEDRAGLALSAAARSATPLGITVADLDFFKQVNDTFGHEAGDRVIANFAQVLRDTAPPHAILGRLGGEEFVMLANADLAEMRQLAERARIGIATTLVDGSGAERQISASFGVAQRRPGDTLSDLLRRADAALYEAKKGGRDQVRTAREDDTTVGDTLAVPPGDRRRGSRRQS